MQNIQILKSEVQEKAQMNLIEFHDILHESIIEWARKHGRHFRPYEELSQLVGLAPQTLRKYSGHSETCAFPPINNLIAICHAIGDWRAYEFLSDYIKQLKGEQ